MQKFQIFIIGVYDKIIPMNATMHNSISASLQYKCADLRLDDENFMNDMDIKERAGYCENVLGRKYSYGEPSLVPGCIDHDTGQFCLCCEPRNSG